MKLVAFQLHSRIFPFTPVHALEGHLLWRWGRAKPHDTKPCNTSPMHRSCETDKQTFWEIICIYIYMCVCVFVCVQYVKIYIYIFCIWCIVTDSPNYHSLSIYIYILITIHIYIYLVICTQIHMYMHIYIYIQKPYTCHWIKQPAWKICLQTPRLVKDHQESRLCLVATVLISICFIAKLSESDTTPTQGM